MKFLYTVNLLLFSSSLCFGSMDLMGIKTQNVEEFWDRGGLILNSTKQHQVSMYNVDANILGGKANFFFIIDNRSDDYVNFLESDLVVIDQIGNFIPLVKKHDVMKNIRSKSSMKKLFSGLLVGMSHAGQPDAGVTQYSSNTRGSIRGNRVGQINYDSQTTGYVYDQNARYQQLQQNAREAQAIENQLSVNEEIKLNGADNYYFANTTLSPRTAQGFNIQINIPKNLLPTLTTLNFHYFVNREEHVFSYQVVQ